jgi:hypothetical protein
MFPIAVSESLLLSIEEADNSAMTRQIASPPEKMLQPL